MNHSKIIVTGTGRSGTTFLIHLFTLLGLDTGYSTSTLDIDPKSFGGLEQDISWPHQIIKNPRFMYQIDGIHDKLKHVIIPVRDLEKASKSRASNQFNSGGLWKASNQSDQEIVLAKMFYRLINSLTKYDIPYTTINFDKLIVDPNYLYNKLSFMLNPNITIQQFIKVHQSFNT